ncbi:MAG: S9 family peptidase [Bacteroidales bacterium]|nr:S9 family peptidase [Bacteroidales bacterium]
MKKIYMLFLVCVMMQAINARKVELKEVARGMFRTEGIAGVCPMADGEHYMRQSSDRKRIEKYSFRTGEKVGVVFDVEKARDISLQYFDGYTMSPDESKILIQTETRRIYRRSFTAVYYIYNVRNNTLEKLSEGGPQQMPLFSPDGNQIAFVRDNNIYLVKLLFGNSESQVTKDGERNKIINGLPDWVYEEEFGMTRAFDFSADSKMIAYLRFDESQVPWFSFPMYKGMAPAFDGNATYPGAYSFKYPMAGIDNSTVTIHSFDIKSQVTRQIALPAEAYDYIPRIEFSKKDDELAIVALNRHQDRFDLYMANARSTMCNLIVRDNIKNYVKEEEYANMRIYTNNIVLMSERDGFNHLYLYTTGGNLVRQITKGKFEVKDFYGYDEKTGTTYYSSNEESPLRTAVYKIDAKGKKTKLSDGIGTNNAIFSTSLKYYMNTFSNTTTPPVYTLRDNNGRLLKTLIDNKALLQKLGEYDVPQKEFFTFTTSEGVTLNGWMMKPHDFDPSKKYAVIMHQYGGPGSQEVLDKWQIGARRDGGMFEAYMLDRGYIAVSVDGRGTGGRGADFEKCTYLNIGVKESRDQVEAALYLATLPYVDKNRIGIWGWSYGGYNTLMSMSEGTPCFRAGVAVAPPTDWRFYDTVYTERFMRMPKENMEGYEASSCMSRAGKLNGALLIVHGSADDNVHFRNTMEYTEALVQADKQFDMHVYTNRNHGISGGNTTFHLLTKITNYFLDKMK